MSVSHTVRRAGSSKLKVVTLAQVATLAHSHWPNVSKSCSLALLQWDVRTTRLSPAAHAESATTNTTYTSTTRVPLPPPPAAPRPSPGPCAAWRVPAQRWLSTTAPWHRTLRTRPRTRTRGAAAGSPPGPWPCSGTAAGRTDRKQEQGYQRACCCILCLNVCMEARPKSMVWRLSVLVGWEAQAGQGPCTDW